jgi:hypothetical protein
MTTLRTTLHRWLGLGVTGNHTPVGPEWPECSAARGLDLQAHDEGGFPCACPVVLLLPKIEVKFLLGPTIPIRLLK